MYYIELESSTVELKREVPKNDQIIKTIIGFCNQNGGKLVIGVNNDGTIIGVSDKKINAIMEHIDKAIYESSYPPIIPRVYTQRIKNKNLLIIEVSSGMNKPYYRKSEGIKKGTYIRLGRNTVMATQEIIEELRWQSMGIDFESIPVYKADKSDLDSKKVNSFLSERKNHGKSKISMNILESYNLIKSEHSKVYPTVNGILLFGKRPQRYFSEAMIILSHFKGLTGRDAIATIDCENTIFEQFDQAYSFILSRLSKSFAIRGPKRKEKLEIPKLAIREALLNAIVHRNYHIKAPIKIAIYDNRIEFFSPGQFPGPLNLNNLKEGITYLRNPNICKIFREAGYIEKLGTGFITIFEEYEKYGLEEPKVIEGTNYIKCILPRELKVKSTLILDDYSKIMNMFKTMDQISANDVAICLSISKSTAIRRLKKLINSKCIKRIGHTKALKYSKIEKK